MIIDDFKEILERFPEESKKPIKKQKYDINSQMRLSYKAQLNDSLTEFDKFLEHAF